MHGYLDERRLHNERILEEIQDNNLNVQKAKTKIPAAALNTTAGLIAENNKRGIWTDRKAQQKLLGRIARFHGLSTH